MQTMENNNLRIEDIQNKSSNTTKNVNGEEIRQRLRKNIHLSTKNHFKVRIISKLILQLYFTKQKKEWKWKSY